MQGILADHNCEGQVEAIFNALRYKGFFPLFAIELLQFSDVGLSITAHLLRRSHENRRAAFCAGSRATNSDRGGIGGGLTRPT